MDIHNFAGKPTKKIILTNIPQIVSSYYQFAIRPSGTEPVMKLYIESYEGPELWQKVHDKAVSLIQ